MPKPTITIDIQDRSVRVSKRVMEEVCLFVAKAEGVRLGLVDLAVVDKDRIAGMNDSFLRHRGPTDVISFDLSGRETAGLCAQIIICGQVAREQATARGLKAIDELLLYVIHGLLHVIGYDDLAIRPAAKMHARQDELLRGFKNMLARRKGSKAK